MRMRKKWGDVTIREMKVKKVSFKFKFKCRKCRVADDVTSDRRLIP